MTIMTGKRRILASFPGFLPGSAAITAVQIVGAVSVAIERVAGPPRVPALLMARRKIFAFHLVSPVGRGKTNGGAQWLRRHKKGAAQATPSVVGCIAQRC
jgi:hypothetical protein